MHASLSGDKIITGDMVGTGTTTPRSVLERIHVPKGMNRLDYGVWSARTRQWTWHDALFFKNADMEHVHNARTAAGAQWEAGVLGNAAGSPANYMAITTDSTAVANPDTVLPTELTTSGLGRMAATYSFLTAQAAIGSTAQYTLQGQWTYSGSSPVVIAKAALFTAATAGIMAFEAVLSPTITVNANGDIAKVLWSVTI
ncbi:MAG: hypothetical protein NVSMB31_01220 [Vulcanimicrobiaceae bacterium]